MKISTRLRVSSALWAFPLVAGIAVLYFFQSYIPEFRTYEGQPGYAPTVVSSVLASSYAMVYAVASSLAAWESGRLRRDGVWALAPARRRFRVAADAVLPVVLLAWLVIAAVVAMALVREGVAPSLPSLTLPALAMSVALAHAVIGFVVGLAVPRLIAAPLLAVGVFYVVAASWSYEPFWLRHVSGQFPVDLMYGELPTLDALLPHILFTGSLAAGLALLCAPPPGTRQRIVGAVLGCAIAMAGTLTAQRMTADWDFNPPLTAGHVPVRCTGSAPAVCAPEALSGDLEVIHRQVTSTLSRLRAAGIEVPDLESVNDSSASGRHESASTERAWWFSLVSSHRSGTTPLAVVTHAVEIPCDEPDPVLSRAALLWAAMAAGAEDLYLSWQREEMRQYTEGQDWLAAAEDRVAEAGRLSPSEQTDWFHAELRRACEPATADGR
ncbi:hypothetical protein [Streptomyces litchfieldiae]|uniref:ABC transporter permease n=1 Tax=Streptomyces litchfieldiae TaxID=3075543 RepID=A0ABU2MLC9_9ACTN|nr:hypothetical protein [Streptomyces sp. DSM 44938]MDT0342408.1 hypothetical protein [Streptomyces sp. DSM 44938]